MKDVHFTPNAQAVSGGRRGAMTIASAIVIGTAVLFVFGLQPIILGGAVDNGLISEKGAGLLAMLELVTLATGALIGPFVMDRMRVKVAIGAAALVAVDLLALNAHNTTDLLVQRTIAGLIEGLLLGPVSLIIAHSARPELSSGLFLGLSGFPQIAFAYLIPLLVRPVNRMSASFIVLAIVSALAVLASPFLVDRVESHSAVAGSKIRWSGPLILLVAAIFLQNAGINAVWAYTEQIIADRGFGAGLIGLVVALGILGQLAGALVTGTLSRFIPTAPGLIAACALQLSMIVVITFVSAPVILTPTLFVLSLLWISPQPLQLAALISGDPSRKLATLLTPIVLFGFAAGPALASVGIRGPHLDGGLYICMALLGLALVLTTLSVRKLVGGNDQPARRAAEPIQEARQVSPLKKAK